MLSKGSVIFVKLLQYALLVITTAVAELCPIYSTSPTCNLLHQIELSMDETANPCEDFYLYVCRNFELMHDKDHLKLANHQVNLKLIMIMDAAYPVPLPKTSANQSIFDKLYIYYKSCINESANKVLRYFELLKPGKDLEWPLLEELRAYRRGDTHFTVNEWPVGQFDIFTLLGQLQSYGLNDVLISQRLSDADSVLVIGRTEKQYYFSQPSLVHVLRDGWGLPEENALKYAENIVNTEKYLYSLYNNHTLAPQNLSISFSRLKQQFPYLSVFLENVYLHKFPDSYKVELKNTRYFELLSAKRWSAREEHDVCNYLMLRFLTHLQEDRVKDFSKLACIKDLRRKLDFPVNLLYYQYVYQPQELFYNREINIFFNKTLYYTRDTLLENHLNLAPAVLDQLRADMSSITLNIGNLARNLRTSQIEKFYRNIPALKRNNYYRNHLHLLRHRVLKSLLQFDNQTYSIINDNFRGTSLMPFYDFRIRQVVLPFGVFQPPLYHHTYDPIFKWSFLGYELAYRIIITALNNVLEGQLSLYEMEPAVRLVSARVAYKAYAHEQRGQLQPEFTNISWKKLFFLNLSQSYCFVEDFNERDDLLRVLSNFIDFESFAEAFQCPVLH